MDAVSETLDRSPPSLRDGLDAIARESGAAEGEGRARALALVKASLGAARAVIRADFEAGAGARATMAATAAMMDGTVRTLLDFAVACVFPAANPTTGDRIAVAAVGGYGRGELAPCSDVDLLFLLPYKRTPRTEQTIEYVLYMLWDAGLKVGHATRTVEDCIRLAREDVTIRTSLLEARFLWGEAALFDELRARFSDELMEGSEPDFVEAKLAERDARHRRLGDSRYVVEPNVKDGKGGLRDLHTLYWIAKYLYRVEEPAQLVPRVFTRAEVARFDKAQDFLNTVRCHLHYLTGRAEDRLTFDVQPEIAARLGYTDHAGTRGVERFMKHYYLTAKDVGDLTRIFCAALEAEHRRRPRFSLDWFRLRRSFGNFVLDGGRLNLRDGGVFDRDPVDMLRLFAVAQQHELDIHPNALRLVTRKLPLVNARLRRDPEANRLFVEMLTSRKDPETTLRRLSEAGVLGRFIPAFGRIVAQMQFDMYHTYTVDEHTIRAIGILHRIEQGEFKDSAPAASEVVHKLLSRRVLYAAVLLHDIAKGRGGDHSVLGAAIAESLCPRLGLDPGETETVAWLVRHHLLMSSTAFKRDLNDPQTARDFAAVVQSPERLRLLLVLTVADIRAVGPDIWNGWKATLLRELYYRADELLSGGSGTGAQAARVAEMQQLVRALLPDWSDGEFARHVADTPPAYWLAFDADALARQARLARRAAAEPSPLLIEARIAHDRAVTEVTVCTPDHPGLFSRIAGAIAVTGGNIVDARIFTLQNGMALDTFWVQDAEGDAFAEPARLQRLEARIRQALSGAINLRSELRREPRWRGRTRLFAVPPQVLIDNKASAAHTVIEVNGRDRPGLLHDVTRALTHLGLQIATARISTYGENAVDVFYVKDIFGLKVAHEGKLRQIRETLLQALAEPEAAKEAPAVPAPPRGRRAAGDGRAPAGSG